MSKQLTAVGGPVVVVVIVVVSCSRLDNCNAMPIRRILLRYRSPSRYLFYFIGQFRGISGCFATYITEYTCNLYLCDSDVALMSVDERPV